MKQKYASTHSSALADMEESFGKNTALATALKFKEGARPTTQVSAGSGPTPPRPARTSASPDWGDAHPPNTARVGTFSHVTLNDFETNNTRLAFSWGFFSCFFANHMHLHHNPYFFSHCQALPSVLELLVPKETACANCPNITRFNF